MTDLTERRSGAVQPPGPPPPDLADDDLALLLERSAAGDEEAFARLYDTTSRLSFGLAMRILRDESTAEQVTRDAYLHLWSHSVRYDPAEGSAIAWITRLVHRRAVDCARLQRHAPTKGAAAVEHLACLAAPAGDRECLELAYFGARTWCEVARAEHVAPVAAAMHIRDALREV